MRCTKEKAKSIKLLNAAMGQPVPFVLVIFESLIFDFDALKNKKLRHSQSSSAFWFSEALLWIIFSGEWVVWKIKKLIEDLN